VIVNDRADLARLAGAAGVHVGQDDLSPAEVRSILGPDALVGLSTHTETQVDDALRQPVTYIAVGPVFETRTKATGYEARGLGLVRYAAGRGTPVVAIGGITLERTASVVAAGASAVAVITDLFAGESAETRTRAFLDELSRASWCDG
jgi:thiamine-phosphate pyrophosphorylase